MSNKNTTIALLVIASLLVSPVVVADENEDIPTNASATGVHDSLVAALDKANLVATLQGEGPFTVFAPTDQAFADAGIDLDSFDTDEEIAALTDILLYHVYSGTVYAADVTDGMTVVMANADHLTFYVMDDTVSMGDGSTVTIADVAASNGVIHVIDKVLMPPADVFDIPTTAQGTGIHDSLVAAVIQADLLETLQGEGPFTVFAPTDQAFTDAGIDLAALDTEEGKAALTDILLYHVVSGSVESSAVTDGMTAAAVNGDDLSFSVGEGVMVNDANVILADVITTNGVIHVIDKVLMPPADLVDIAAVAMSTGVHESLVAALVKADLVSTLQGDGPFTVFAPTDQAFTDAGIDLDAFSTDEEITALANILLYHVYSGAVNAADVTDGLTVAMVNGDDATFTVTDGTVMVGDATVTTADVMASNGVIHVIDKVLMPPADEPVIPEGCDFVIGLSDDGTAFDNTDLSIAVGQTVCWIWNDATMAHNIAQIKEEGDTTRDAAGEYSGTAATTIDYRITFTEDEMFYYICEPHATMGMNGQVVVGTGISKTPTTVVDSDNNIPGFTAGIAAIALIGALVISGARRR